MVDAPSDDEWHWLFGYLIDENGNVVHGDDVYGSEPNEIETDPQYGRLDRNSY